MKKHFLILFIVILSLSGYSQITFEKGYYINDSSQKVECLIKNIDWKKNPTEFIYKLSEDDEPKTASISSVKEFGIINSCKYRRFNVKIDRSSTDLDNLSRNRDPQFEDEQLFLKTLVEGKANLYSYAERNMKKYFYQIDSGNIEQLIYKKYIIQTRMLGENRTYTQQLINLKCQDINTHNINSIGYNKNELVRFFVRYNNSDNIEPNNYDEIQKYDWFNLRIRPGVNFPSLSVLQTYFVWFSDDRSVDFETELSYRFGIEAEVVLPFNKNKWAFLIEPTYQYFKSEQGIAPESVKVDYKSIELPLGVRHYFFLNKNSKIFINSLFVIDFCNIKSKIEYYEPGHDLIISTRVNGAFGIGYNYHNKFGLELRYGAKREILSDYIYFNSNYQSMSIVFGYTIL